MSRRTGVIGQGVKDVEPLPSPNYYVPQVTVEVRVFFPPNATIDDITAALQAALNDAQGQIKEKLNT